MDEKTLVLTINLHTGEMNFKIKKLLQNRMDDLMKKWFPNRSAAKEVVSFVTFFFIQSLSKEKCILLTKSGDLKSFDCYRKSELMYFEYEFSKGVFSKVLSHLDKYLIKHWNDHEFLGKELSYGDLVLEKRHDNRVEQKIFLGHPLSEDTFTFMSKDLAICLSSTSTVDDWKTFFKSLNYYEIEDLKKLEVKAAE